MNPGNRFISPRFRVATAQTRRRRYASRQARAKRQCCRVRFRLSAGLLCLLLAGGAVKRQEPARLTVDPAKAFAMLEELVALGPRPSGSAGARKNAEYIAAKCKAFGYQPELDEWTEQTAHGPLTFRNVYAVLEGRGRSFVILGSHYDTKVVPGVPDFAGANDGASSTALLLEIMRTLKQQQWDGPSIRFAFFDGEECVTRYRENDGLHGSKRLAASLKKKNEVKRCAAMVLLDMIGDKDLKITISPNDDSKLIARVQKIAKEQKVEKHFGFFLKGSILDDHVPFKKLGIPAIDLIDFEFGPNNSYWHTSEDSLDKVCPGSLEIVGNLAIRLLQTLPPR